MIRNRLKSLKTLSEISVDSLHKRTFCLASGRGLSHPDLEIATFPVRVREGEVLIEVPVAG